MQIQNAEVASLFIEVADLLEIEGANPFRVRAYRNAARTLLTLPERISDLVDKHEDLSTIPTIGKDLAHKIEEIVETGHLSLLDDVKKNTPTDLRELLNLPQLGPKRIQILHRDLGINSVNDLRKAVEKGQLLKLKGFGKKLHGTLQEALKKSEIAETPRLLLTEADEIANEIVGYLQKAPSLQNVIAAGSLRRRKETVGDLDLLVTGTDRAALMDYFLKLEKIDKILAKGSTRSAVVLKSGLQVDVRVVPTESYGAALLYFTGSKAHNIGLRRLAMSRGLKINEYGLFKNKKRLASKTEAEIYEALGLTYIEPELRENRGEIGAAARRQLPHLVSSENIRGDLHLHTKATDGTQGILELAQAAQKRGYSYIAITDHSQSLRVAHGLNARQLQEQWEEIDKINSTLTDFTILKSLEVDILEDGTLDLPNEVLSQLDLTVCSIHSHFQLSKEKQTRRILKAMENPYFNILAHPTGRLIHRREPLKLDMERILKQARQRKCVLEINGQPERLDLPDRYCKKAKEMGIKFSIATDAHSINQFSNMNLALGQARRGWIEASDVINTFSAQQIKQYFAGDRS